MKNATDSFPSSATRIRLEISPTPLSPFGPGNLSGVSRIHQEGARMVRRGGMRFSEPGFGRDRNVGFAPPWYFGSCWTTPQNSVC